jgi:hypothetical protein
MIYTDKTLIKCVVNFKCLGYFGRGFRRFPLAQRKEIIDELAQRGWITDDGGHLSVGENAKSIILCNLDLVDK